MLTAPLTLIPFSPSPISCSSPLFFHSPPCPPFYSSFFSIPLFLSLLFSFALFLMPVLQPSLIYSLYNSLSCAFITLFLSLHLSLPPPILTPSFLLTFFHPIPFPRHPLFHSLILSLPLTSPPSLCYACTPECQLCTITHHFNLFAQPVGAMVTVSNGRGPPDQIMTGTPRKQYDDRLVPQDLSQSNQGKRTLKGRDLTPDIPCAIRTKTGESFIGNVVPVQRSTTFLLRKRGKC